MLSEIILKLMAKCAEDRYQSAFGLGADLKQCLDMLASNKQISSFVIGRRDVPDRLQTPVLLLTAAQTNSSCIQGIDLL